MELGERIKLTWHNLHGRVAGFFGQYAIGQTMGKQDANIAASTTAEFQALDSLEPSIDSPEELVGAVNELCKAAWYLMEVSGRTNDFTGQTKESFTDPASNETVDYYPLTGSKFGSEEPIVISNPEEDSRLRSALFQSLSRCTEEEFVSRRLAIYSLVDNEDLHIGHQLGVSEMGLVFIATMEIPKSDEKVSVSIISNRLTFGDIFAKDIDNQTLYQKAYNFMVELYGDKLPQVTDKFQTYNVNADNSNRAAAAFALNHSSLDFTMMKKINDQYGKLTFPEGYVDGKGMEFTLQNLSDASRPIDETEPTDKDPGGLNESSSEIIPTRTSANPVVGNGSEVHESTYGTLLEVIARRAKVLFEPYLENSRATFSGKDFFDTHITLEGHSNGDKITIKLRSSSNNGSYVKITLPGDDRGGKNDSYNLFRFQTERGELKKCGKTIPKDLAGRIFDILMTVDFQINND